MLAVSDHGFLSCCRYRTDEVEVTWRDWLQHHHFVVCCDTFSVVQRASNITRQLHRWILFCTSKTWSHHMFEKLFKHIQETHCCNMVLHEKCLKCSDCKLVQFLSYATQLHWLRPLHANNKKCRLLTRKTAGFHFEGFIQTDIWYQRSWFHIFSA